MKRQLAWDSLFDARDELTGAKSMTGFRNSTPMSRQSSPTVDFFHENFSMPHDADASMSTPHYSRNGEERHQSIEPSWPETELPEFPS